MKYMLGHILVKLGGSRKEGIAGDFITGNTMQTFFQCLVSPKLETTG